MMPAMFLSLLKEEPLDSNTEIDSSADSSSPIHMGMRSLELPPPLTPITPTSMQPPPLIPMNLQTLGLRRDIEPNFEPVSRGRSNTWPLPCPEGFIEEDNQNGDNIGHGEHRPPISLGMLEHIGGGPMPKKNTSRRNPWGNMSYADLIAQAITSSGEGRATLSQIYDWMVHNVPYFKDKGDSNSSAGWKNSIRHNLSLHNRFMRVQNEGTGKSSWWVLNPDAKPGKNTRRRANTLEGGGRFSEKKRGRVKKKLDILRNGLDTTPSPSSSLNEGIDCYPDSPLGAMHGGPYQLSPTDYRQRASSNASSCGRLSPIPAIESDMHDTQVPPISPGVAAWPAEYWVNHPHHPHNPHVHHVIGPPPPHTPHDRFQDQLAESLGDGMKLGGGPPEWHGPRMPHHPSPPDCVKMPPHHPLHMNGFVHPHPHAHHPPGFNNFDDFHRFGAPHHHGPGGPFPHPGNRGHPHPFPPPPGMQAMSPAHPPHPSHSLSPSIAGEPHFPRSSCDNMNNVTSVEMKAIPLPFTSPQIPHHSPPSVHHQTPPHPACSSTSPSGSNRSISPQPSTSKTCTSQPGPSNSHDRPTVTSKESCDSPVTTEVTTRPTTTQKTAGSSGGGQEGGSGGQKSTTDLMDLEDFQGGLECNVEEVIKHELQYDEDLNFDFPHGQGHAHSNHPHGHPRESRELNRDHPHPNPHPHPHPHPTHAQGNVLAFPGPPGPPVVKPTYSCQSIAAGNQWVR